MPSLRLDRWSVAFPLAFVLGGCVFHCGGDDHDEYECEGRRCYDDDDGYDDGWEDDGVPKPDGGGGQGGEGGGAIPICDATDVLCVCDGEVACPSDLTCVGGVCIAACGFDYDCGPGTVCGNGQCVQACDVDTPCEAGFACKGGGCLADPLTPQCNESIACADASLSCVEGFCTTLCTKHSECATGQLCNGLSGACVPDLSPVPLCGLEMACPGQGQACLTGVCHYECSIVDECKLIDARFDFCDRGFCKTDLEMNPECTAANLCEGGAPCVSNVCVLAQ